MIFKNFKKETVVIHSDSNHSVRFTVGQEREVPKNMEEFCMTGGMTPMESPVESPVEDEAAKKRSEAAKKAAATRKANEANK